MFIIKNYALKLLFLFFVINTGYAQITGTVFRDYNGNGTQEAGEPGRGDIIIKAYSNALLPAKDQLVGMTTSNSDGTYTLNPTSYPVRIEFEIPDGFCNMASDEDYPAANGDTYGSSVQTALASGEVHDFVINYPYDFSTDENPFSYVAVMSNGDPLDPVNSTGKDFESLIRTKYRNSGYASNSGRGETSGAPWDKMTTAKQTGTIWGVAFSRQSKKIWAASNVRRHAGIGPLGSGGIYWLDAEPPYDLTADLKFINFDELGIPTSDQVNPYTDALTGNCSNVVTFSPVLGTNAERDLPKDHTQPSEDPAAWDQVGKLSFGDMDISSDGRYLYVVNLYDRKLYEIDLVDAHNPQIPTAANAATRIMGYDIPNPCGGNAGEYRPWGIKYARNKIYVGVVCSAQNADGSASGGDASDMTGNIFEFDAVAHTFDPTSLISWTFDYRNSGRPWLPWRADWWRDAYEANGSPIISDIEFDANGNFIFGIMDRHGSQCGHKNVDLCGNSGDDIAMVADILQAVRDPNSNSCSYNIQLDPEYYDDSEIHTESSMGALSVHFTAEFDGILSTYMDPIGIYSSGVTLFDNTTGGRVSTTDANGGSSEGYEIIYSSSSNLGKFGKANSLGDVETFEIVPPIEIGNLVWLDEDRDGIQDGSEPGIPGVEVELVDNTNTVVATETTDAKGGYYFNHTNVNVPNGPDYNSNYTIRIKSTQYNNSTGFGPLDTYYLTLTDQNGTGSMDYSDNDATINGGLATIQILTGAEGQNNHTYDFGFAPPCSIDVLSAVPTACDSLTSTYSLDVSITHQYSPGGNVIISLSNGVSQTFVSTGTSPESFTMTLITSDGMTGVDVTAEFEDDNLCVSTLMDAFDAPESCCPPPYEICFGDTLILVGPAGHNSYQWQVENNVGVFVDIVGETNQNLVVTEFGNYIVTGNDPNSCSSGLCCVKEVIKGPDCCEMDVPTVTTECNDNGTPGDTTDDLFYYFITVTGTGTSTYSISGSDAQMNLAYGVENGPYGPFNIAGGGLILTTTDDVDPECQQDNIIIFAPAPCSFCPPPVCLPVNITVN